MPGIDRTGRHPGAEGLSRRAFTRWAGAAAVGVPVIGSVGACSGPDASSAPTVLPIASPDKPVTWPIAEDNKPIESGLPPEKDATLKVYNYADYLDPAGLDAFEEKFASSGVKVEVTTFNDYTEALAKVRGGDVELDVMFIGTDILGKLVTAGLLRPLNHDYIPNIANVWPEFTNPYYDQEWRYTVPYIVYTTGIAWRTDIVSDDIGAMENPWEAFWTPEYAGKLTVLDDYRETIVSALLRRGITDVNTSDEDALAAAQADLLDLNDVTRPKVTINYYSELPEGQHGLSMAWSGDANNFQYYMPDGGDPSVFRYWHPSGAKGRVDNDMIAVLSSGKNPVLAHEFVNFMLDTDVALGNFGATGYQPPQVSLTPEDLVAEGYVLGNLAEAVVLPDDYQNGLRLQELPPEVEGRWQAVWQQFKAGA
jgi:spermidine/putrescine transport system substrate-binding protein